MILDLETAVNTMAVDGDPDRVGLLAMFSASRDFSNEWNDFLHPAGAEPTQTLRLDLSNSRFPFVFGDKGIEITAMYLFLRLNERFVFEYADGPPLTFDLRHDGGSEFPNQRWTIAGSPVGLLPFSNPFVGRSEDLGTWLIEVHEDDIPSGLAHGVEIEGTTRTRLNPEALEDILVVCQYSLQPAG